MKKLLFLLVAFLPICFGSGVGAQNTQSLSQEDIDIYCNYCKLIDQSFASSTELDRAKLTGMWADAGWTQERAVFAVPRITQVYNALVLQEDNAIAMLEYIIPSDAEKALVQSNGQKLTDAFSLLEKFATR